jgi:uncharacterized protein YggE
MRQLLPVVATACLLALCVPAMAADASPPTISIEGRGEVVAAPDTAQVTAGVTTEGKTAREALDANTKAMTDLVAVLKDAGIDSKDIQTSGFSVNPQYYYPEHNSDGSQPPPRITGYTVQNGVDVKVRKLDSLGTLLDQMVSAGGNTINSVSFSVEDTSKLLEEARKAAFADAAAKARTYADAAGVGLGPVQSIAEATGETPPPRPVMFKALANAAPSAPVPVQGGQLTFDVEVSVVWLLKTGSE